MKKYFILFFLLIINSNVFAQSIFTDDSWFHGSGKVTLTTITDNVGIGSTFPGQKLDVSGTLRTTDFIDTAVSASSVIVTNSSKQLTAASNLQDLAYCQTGGTNCPAGANLWSIISGSGTSAVISRTGNVGIGTPLPTVPLQVNGNSLFNSPNYAQFNNSSAFVLGTGGTMSSYVSAGVTYEVHVFSSSGTFVAPSPATHISYLVVGIGGTNVNQGGAGGAGDFIPVPDYAASGSQSIPVTVATVSGNSSSFLTTTAIAGGNANGGDGASGAGSGSSSVPAGNATGVNGHKGGAGFTSSPNVAGGGGGCGAVGQDHQAGNTGGNGGIGCSSSITGTLQFYSSGGGGYGFSGSGTQGSSTIYGSGATQGGSPQQGVVIISYVIPSEAQAIYSNGTIGINDNGSNSSLSIKSSGNTSATSSIIVANTSSTKLFSLFDDGTAYLKGNLGIGSLLPGQTLDVTGTVRMTGFNITSGAASGKLLTSDANGNGTWVSPATSGTVASIVAGTGLTGGTITSTGTIALDLTHANTWTGQQIFNTANVGIGSSSPGQVLDVNGTVRASGFTQTGASVSTFAGNVGLGLTVPSYLLDVNGAARLNGILNFVPSTTGGLDGGTSSANSAGSAMNIISARGGVGGGTQEAGGALNLESGNGWSLNGSLTNAPVNIFAGQSDGIGTVQGWIDIHGASPFGGGYTNNENGGHVYIHGGDGYGGGSPGNGGNVFVSAGKGNGTSNVNGTVILGYSGIAESNTSVGDITNVSIGTKTATSQLTVAGAYTQTGSLANTITGTTSFSGSPSITTSGNVGIGSTAPGTALDVNGTIRATSYQGVFPSSSAGQILASPSANTPTWTSNILVSGTNTLFTAGNVGIGSSAPGTALDVIGTVRIGGGSGNQYLSGSGGNVGIGTTLSALNRLDIAGNASIGTSYAGYQSAPSNGLIVQGNVGIGSTVPGQILDVGGTVRFTNSLINTKSSTGIGWSEHNATNQACNTTCGTSACVMALDIGTVGVINSGFVSCSDATADDCECAGP